MVVQLLREESVVAPTPSKGVGRGHGSGGPRPGSGRKPLPANQLKKQKGRWARVRPTKTPRPPDTK